MLNYFLCIFSGKTFFLFIELRILMATNLMENFKSERLSCKISVSGRLGRSIHMRKGNDPKRKKTKTFSALNECNGAIGKFKFRNSIVKFLLVWHNQSSRLHPPLHYSIINTDKITSIPQLVADFKKN